MFLSSYLSNVFRFLASAQLCYRRTSRFRKPRRAEISHEETSFIVRRSAIWSLRGRNAGRGAAGSNDFSAAEVAALPMVSCFAVFLCGFAPLREKTVVLKSNLTQRREGAKTRKDKLKHYQRPGRPEAGKLNLEFIECPTQ